jgi:putative ABC transport system substrate-binding protein
MRRFVEDVDLHETARVHQSGTAVGWPVALRAQQAERMRQIGVMLLGAGNDPAWRVYATALRRGLTAAGYSQGRNLAIEYRWA